MCTIAAEQAAVVVDNSKARSLTGVAKEVSTFMGDIWPRIQETAIGGLVAETNAPSAAVTKTAAAKTQSKKVEKTSFKMPEKSWDTRAVMHSHLRETLEKLAIKYANKPKLKLIQSLQSQLAPDVIDDDVLEHALIAVCNNFQLRGLS